MMLPLVANCVVKDDVKVLKQSTEYIGRRVNHYRATLFYVVGKFLHITTSLAKYRLT